MSENLGNAQARRETNCLHAFLAQTYQLCLWRYMHAIQDKAFLSEYSFSDIDSQLTWLTTLHVDTIPTGTLLSLALPCVGHMALWKLGGQVIKGQSNTLGLNCMTFLYLK